MPTIGWFEILIVVAIAIVILGPKDFPIMLKKVGSWIGTAKKYINNIQNEVSEIAIDDNEMKEEKVKKDNEYRGQRSWLYQSFSRIKNKRYITFL